jgi:hypothetical protein
MSDPPVKFGVVGLGRMGRPRDGCIPEAHAVGRQDTGGSRTELAEAGVESVKDLASLRDELAPPRPSSFTSRRERALDDLLQRLDPAPRPGFHFADRGTSGGVSGPCTRLRHDRRRATGGRARPADRQFRDHRWPKPLRAPPWAAGQSTRGPHP